MYVRVIPATGVCCGKRDRAVQSGLCFQIAKLDPPERGHKRQVDRRHVPSVIHNADHISLRNCRVCLVACIRV
jgi:hypothetical protein